MALPKHVIGDLVKCLLMFIVGLIALRYTVVYTFGIDLFDFSKPLPRIVAGLASLLVGISVVKIFTDPSAARKLGQQIAGKQYRKEVSEQLKRITAEGSANEALIDDEIRSYA